MVYTVKKLSELSGLTVRAIHFYEEAGLLKPAYYGENGYRYYEERQLLELQQILFYKELGLTIKQIQKVLGRSDFDIIKALHAHKSALSSEWSRIGQLIQTIDKTLQHLNGEKKMKDQEIFTGFSLVKKGKETDSYFAAEKLVLRSVKNPSLKKPENAEAIAQAAHVLFKELAACIEKGEKSNSVKVQQIIAKHHAFTEQIHNATPKVYKALAQLYREHPEFRKQMSPFHPQLPDFMADAMSVYADKKLG